MQPGDPGDLGAFGLQQAPAPQLTPEQAAQGLAQLQAALVQAHQMQHKLMEAQQQIAATQVYGQAGDGLVQVALTGQGEVVGIWIQPEAVNPNDVETLQELILASLRDAAENMREQVKAVLGPLAAEAGQPMPE